MNYNEMNYNEFSEMVDNLCKKHNCELKLDISPELRKYLLSLEDEKILKEVTSIIQSMKQTQDWVDRGMPEDEIDYCENAPKLTAEQLQEFEPASFTFGEDKRMQEKYLS